MGVQALFRLLRQGNEVDREPDAKDKKLVFDNNQEADNEPGSAAAMLSQIVVSGNNDNDHK